MFGKPDKDDPLKNRRTYVYALLYVLILVIINVNTIIWFKDISAALVGSIFGIASIIFGFVAKVYFDQCGKDDENNK